MQGNMAKAAIGVAIGLAFSAAIVGGCAGKPAPENAAPSAAPPAASATNGSLQFDIQVERGMQIDALQRTQRHEAYQPKELERPVEHPRSSYERVVP